MKFLSQVSTGVLATFVSAAIVFGSLLLAFVEGAPRLYLPTAIPSQPATLITPGWMQPNKTAPAMAVTETPLAQLPPTSTLVSVCIPPENWNTVITVMVGDTLEALAESYFTTAKQLRIANCLPTNLLYPGMYLYVPSLVPTATAYLCGPPYGWVFYTVQPGDTLSSIARRYYTTVLALQQANCMGSSDFIRAGTQIYVPYVATSTPIVLPTSTLTLQPTSTLTPLPTLTPTPVFIPTSTPTDTLTPVVLTPTTEPSMTSTSTPVEITPTPTSTLTITPLPISTDTPTPTATNTPLPTVTERPTATVTDTPLPTLTETPVVELDTPTPTLATSD